MSPPRAHRALRHLIIGVLGLGLGLGPRTLGQDEGPQRYEFTEVLMGVQARIVLYAPEESLARAAARAAFDRIAQLDRVMSDYRPDSEAMRASRSVGPTRISEDLFRVLHRANEIAVASDGAFDVTVGPLVQLWRDAIRRGILPDAQTLAQARQRTGWRWLVLDASGPSLDLRQPGMRLDFGGIGKGFAADEAVSTLGKLGIPSCLIDLGGDITLGEPPPGQGGWRVRLGEDATREPLVLSRAAVATSGDTEQFVEIDGQRYSHLLDPRSGLGLTDRSQVTVIAKDGATADALATAVSVLGPEQGLALVRAFEGSAMVERTAGGTKSHRESPGFPAPFGEGNPTPEPTVAMVTTDGRSDLQELDPMANMDRAGPESDEQRMAWWRESRFGLFIHWGLYAIPAGQWEDQTNHGEWIMNSAQIPVERYEQFLGQFDPVRFDADRWVKTAKDAGMKYIVITSKHHDGFCLFDSKQTDYDVMATPFRRDIMKELAAACRREGLRIGWYHSIMDWHHPDYLPRRRWEQRSAEGADFTRYLRHLHEQVTELLSNYGDIGVMWFDGEWERTWSHEQGQALYDLCRRLQPSVIVNNRVDIGRAGMEGLTKAGRYAGDFGTPEQQVPPTGLPGVDWEACVTMNDHWGYNRNDANWKSAEELIRLLVDIASKGGNLLLNVGPTAEGEFPQSCVERLQAMGRWLRVNGEAIYGTEASPFRELPWGRCTVRALPDRTRLYLHVFDWPVDGVLRVSGLGNDVNEASLLAAPQTPLAIAQDVAELRITLPASPPDPLCSVVVLEIEGRPVVYEAPTIRAASPIFVDPLEVELTGRSETLEYRYTIDGSEPTATSSRYDGPFFIDDTAVLKARAFHRGRAVSAVSAAQFTRVTPIAPVTADDVQPGLICETYTGTWDRLPDVEALEPAQREIVAGVVLPPGPRQEFIARRFRGFITVPDAQVYVFSLTSDDGSRLSVAEQSIIDNDGLHGAQERQGVIALSAGLHAILVEYFNKTGGAELILRCAPIGEEPTEIPPTRFRYAPDR